MAARSVVEVTAVDEPAAKPRRRGATVAAWSVAAVAVLLAGVGVPVLELALGNPSLFGDLLSPGVVMALTFAPVGAVIVTHEPRNAIGWIFCAAGVSQALVTFSQAYGTLALVDAPEHGLPGGVLAAWLSDWVWFVGYGLLATFLLLLFPTGRLPSRRWRPVGWLAGAAFGLMITAAVASIPLQPGRTTVGQPLEGEALAAYLGGAAFFTMLIAAPLCLAGLLVRVRRSEGVQRQQLKWFAWAGTATVVIIVGANLAVDGGPATDAVHALVAVLVPAGAVIGIVRHRLFDIDLVINRSLVYGVLSAGVIGIYVLLVSLGERLLQRSGLGPSVLAAGVIAVLFQPARERLQRGVDQLLYGDRADPYGALSRLGHAVETSPAIDAVLPTIAETIARALRLPHVTIEIEGPEPITARWGRARGEPYVLPLTAGSRPFGRLEASPRGPTERLTAAELRLLENLGRQAAAAAHAVLLTAELTRARAQLVTTREEERRRLRRDLHDELGPTLGAVALELGAARRLLAGDPESLPESLDDLLAKLATRVEDAIADVRRLARGLRPPALDELGLAAAVTELGERLSAAIEIKVDAVGLGPLPAAVDVAAYRIVQEALTNVTRHAAATRCTVRLWRDEAVHVEVTDDGRGLPPRPQGEVGLHSMRERAAELGGTCTIESAETGGTRVHARLPVTAP